MLWVSLAATDTGNLVQVHGILKKEAYIDIVRDNGKKSAASLALESQWVFQLVQNLWKASKIKVLMWPSNGATE